ncbi:MAG TPA: response regulator [Pyrinomonadaceae bacterium]|jgi:DNA-binding NtrC family response regulator|nr:response regulator [Pyrinomonadaceae bacterium]
MSDKQKLSILYFDDDPACLEVFREMFARDHDVTTAATLAEARRALDESAFDVIISDLSMPEISGTAFLRETARTHPESFRVMLTGSAFVGELMGEIAAGVAEFFVPKPWNALTMGKVFERARL